MKCYHELKCDELDIIQKEVLTWLNERYDLSDQNSLQTDLWLKIDYKDLIRNTPTLVRWFKELKLVFREISVTVVNNIDGAGLHIDELPIVAKINIPILNYKYVVNEWYSVPEELLNQYLTTNKFGSQYHDLTKLDIKKCTLLGSIIPVSPIVFNSQIAHRVIPQQQAMFPRVMLSCMFFNEPVNYLND